MADKEIGVVGLNASYGRINEDFRRELKYEERVKTYKEMSIDDATISGILYIIKSLLIKANWKVVATDDRQSIKDAEFIESCFTDMSFTFSDFLDEILTMIEYGYSFFEIVYKLRKDGKIGWRKFAFRSQDTIFRWAFDADGGIMGAYQTFDGKEVLLPIEKCLLFRTSTRKNNPEGQSLLRGCYKPWMYKKHIEEYEGIGVERDLAGFPLLRVPSSVWADSAKLEHYKRIARNIKVDEETGLVIPSDVKDGMRMYDFELITASGTKNFDTDKIINRYDTRIAMSLSADFMLLGQTGAGSWALSTDKTDMFQLSLNAISLKIAEVINSYAIPRLMEANGMKRDEYPVFSFDSVAKRDLKSMAEIITSLSSSGMSIFPNPEIEESILNMLGFPDAYIAEDFEDEPIKQEPEDTEIEPKEEDTEE